MASLVFIIKKQARSYGDRLPFLKGIKKRWKRRDYVQPTRASRSLPVKTAAIFKGERKQILKWRLKFFGSNWRSVRNRPLFTPCEQILRRSQWYKWNQLLSYRHRGELLLTFSQPHQENALLESLLSTTGRVSAWWDNSTVGHRREKRKLTLERRLCDLIGEKACRNEKREIKERRKITSQIKRRKIHKPIRKNCIPPLPC